MLAKSYVKTFSNSKLSVMDSKLIELIPTELLNTSGSVFYTGKSAWNANRSLYILGLNPGGDNIERQRSQTLEYHTTKTNIPKKLIGRSIKMRYGKARLLAAPLIKKE